MSGWRLVLLSALAMGTFPHVLMAADLNEALSVDPPEIHVGEGDVGHGWYMRGELGYSAIVNADAPQYRNFDAANGNSNAVVFDSARFGKGLSASVGLGYQFNEWLRTDVTGDYFSSGFSGASTSAAPCSALQSPGTTCSNSYSADYSALGIMANGYVDLGTVIGFTPYVGAGAGAYNVNWSGAKDAATCVNGAGTCAEADSGSTFFTGTSEWRLAYSLMAGVSYEVAANTVLDVGYRYTHIAGGTALKFSDADLAAGAQGSKAADSDLSRHEIRAGIRIQFW